MEKFPIWWRAKVRDGVFRHRGPRMGREATKPQAPEEAPAVRRFLTRRSGIALHRLQQAHEGLRAWAEVARSVGSVTGGAARWTGSLALRGASLLGAVSVRTLRGSARVLSTVARSTVATAPRVAARLWGIGTAAFGFLLSALIVAGRLVGSSASRLGRASAAIWRGVIAPAPGALLGVGTAAFGLLLS